MTFSGEWRNGETSAGAGRGRDVRRVSSGGVARALAEVSARCGGGGVGGGVERLDDRERGERGRALHDVVNAGAEGGIEVAAILGRWHFGNVRVGGLRRAAHGTVSAEDAAGGDGVRGAATGESGLLGCGGDGGAFAGFVLKFNRESFISFNTNISFDFRIILLAIVGASVGSVVGSMFSTRVKAEKLNIAFGWFVILVAAFIFFENLNGAITH